MLSTKRGLVGTVGVVVILLLLASPFTQAQYVQTFNPAITKWAKYSLVKIANGVNGCANANGCWQVNGVLGPNAAAALTQSVTLYTKPARGYVSSASIKVATRCTGATTVTTGMGAGVTTGFFIAAAAYNPDTVVADTNLYNASATPGRATAAAEVVTADLVTTVDNIDQLVTGCAIEYWTLQGVLP